MGARGAARLMLGGALVFAGISHLTFARRDFRAQVPDTVVELAPLDEDGIAMAEAQLQIEHYWAGALRRAVIDGDVEGGSLMAGQSVGMVKSEEPVADIIAQLMAQSEVALGRR